MWHRPSKCDIIPLAKLQTLKQNTDPTERRESSTQTSLGNNVSAAASPTHSNLLSSGQQQQAHQRHLQHLSSASSSPSNASKGHHHSTSRQAAQLRHSGSGQGASNFTGSPSSAGYGHRPISGSGSKRSSSGAGGLSLHASSEEKLTNTELLLSSPRGRQNYR